MTDEEFARYQKYLAEDKANIKPAYEQYRELAGEVEARNVQKRATMTPEERKNTPISETEDIPRSEQTVRYMLNPKGVALIV